MATTASFTTTPRNGLLRITAGSAARDTIVAGAGNLLYTGGANGSRVNSIDVVSSAAEGGAAAARVLRIWEDNGTSILLKLEVEIPAITASATVKGAAFHIPFSEGLLVPNGSFLRATLSVAGANDATNVIANGGDY